MKIQLLETKTGKLVPAFIGKATVKDMPFKKDGWNFNWRNLFKEEGAEVYKVSLDGSPNKIEGIIIFQLKNDEMLEMNNIEIAPYNIGNAGKYKRVSGVLIAFCCIQSLTLGKGNYKGFVSFESKTSLISYYQNKYGATQIIGQKMFFDQETGAELIKKYLNNEEA
jgi:hypothetical protein